MKYEVVELKEKKVVGIIKRTTNENMQSMKDIGEMWQKFIGEEVYKNIENKVDEQAIGLYTDYEKDCSKPYNFMACLEVSSFEGLNGELKTKIIKEGKYAKFSVRGNVEMAVREVWEEVWKLNLNRKYECDFEVYHNNSQDINDQIIDVYISIE